MWDKFSDKVSRYTGDKSFFFGFTIAAAVWTFLGYIGLDDGYSAFTLFLSILAIWLLVFLQNSQNREQAGQAKTLRADLKSTKKILRLLEHIDRKL